MIKRRNILTVIALLLAVFITTNVFGSSGEAAEGHDFAKTFLWIAIILIAAKLSSLVEKYGQPAVLGELVIGVILGNLVLLGFHGLEPIKADAIIAFLAELGVVILLFQIGLESNMKEMSKVGFKAGIVAVLGVIVPFVLGTWVVGPWLLPGLTFNAYLFLGATLTATSVGITARVFKDLNKLKTKEAQIVLGAAVIDDVLGLIILAVVSAIVTAGSVSAGTIGLIFGKAVLFLVGSIVVGQLTAPGISRIFAKINAGVGMKFTLAICFGLLFAYFASVIGLAPIVGAFAAGLVLDAVHFKYFKDPKIVADIKKHFKEHHAEENGVSEILHKHSERHVEEIVEPIGLFLVPIFFVMTGFAVDLTTLFNLKVLLVALGITIVAILGKLVVGLVAGKVNKWVVGWGMVPRGEVGLIFATIGKGLGVVDDSVFSVIVIVVILTTLIPPVVLNLLLRKETKEQHL
ncbi:sodium:proton exchanger [Candidatus Woesearchaeota archaeon CG10_big_fil_rev_8_21_14_0_10_45_16]|nr:MAG: sodium:proton exchanger [Candidatus Woesearchaeota archaeon CG10_big_fil_rev_8_21_14_0_10_45_16]